MKNITIMVYLWFLIMTFGIGKNSIETKIFTADEFDMIQESMHTMNEKEGQEAKKVAEYFSTLIVAGKEAGLKDGHTPTSEQELVMMDAAFPFMQADNIKKGKIRVDFSLKCFENAYTLDEVNSCNKKANELSHFIKEDFQQWNKQIKENTLKHLSDYVPCLEASKSLEDLNNC